jgi:hypothetical protein
VGQRTVGVVPVWEAPNMSHTTSPKLWWSLWMSLGGVAAAATVYAVTENAGWAIVALLGAGMVLNSLSHPRARR